MLVWNPYYLRIALASSACATDAEFLNRAVLLVVLRFLFY